MPGRRDFAWPFPKITVESDPMNVQQAIAEFLEHGQTVRNLSDRSKPFSTIRSMKVRTVL